MMSHAASGMAHAREPLAMKAPQKKSAARGWKFGRVSGKMLPMMRNAMSSTRMMASGRRRFMRGNLSVCGGVGRDEFFPRGFLGMRGMHAGKCSA